MAAQTPARSPKRDHANLKVRILCTKSLHLWLESSQFNNSLLQHRDLDLRLG